MKAFGYDKNDEEYDEILTLSQVTLSCNKEDLDRIIAFLHKVKNESENITVDDNYHWHYRDFFDSWTEEESDFIIFMDNETSR